MKVFTNDSKFRAATIVNSNAPLSIPVVAVRMLFLAAVALLSSCAREPSSAQAESQAGLPTAILAQAGAPTGSVPRIMTYAPDHGPVAAGSFLLLEGTGFLPTTKAAFGTFSAQIAQDAEAVVYLSPNQLLVLAPAYFPGKADFIVYNSTVEYDYRLQGFTYQDPPAPTPIANPQPEAGDTLGLYAMESSEFTLLPAGAESSLDIRFQLGFSRFQATLPIAGSFDGLPGDTVGYYDSFAHHFLLRTDNSYARQGDIEFDFGDATGNWVPVAGRFQGGNVSTVGIFNAATSEFRLKYSNTPGPADVTFHFGTGSKYDAPFAGDFDGDGVDTVGVYNALSGQVLIRNSNSDGPADISYTAGALNQVPVVGDWNHAGRDSVAFFDHVTQQLQLPDRVIQIAPSTIFYSPLAGHWRAPSAPAESTGYAWPQDTLANQRISAGPVIAAYAAASAVPNLRSMLVIRNSKLVAEAYFHGTKASDALDVHSVTKSVTSALYGIALAEGTITPQQFFGSIYDLLPEYAPADPNSHKWKITPAHLLTMSAGLDWWDDADHFKAWDLSPDMIKYTLDLPMLKDAGGNDVNPGDVWRYNSGLTHIAGRILTKLTGRDLSDYAAEKLFSPLGIRALRWDHDVQGFKYGSGSIFMKPRDMARIGQLYLNRGTIDGKQIVPASWVDATTKKVFSVNVPTRPNYSYGTGWWTDVIAGHPIYTALGWGGQWIIEVPDLQLVVVVTSKGDVPGQMDGIQDSLIVRLLSAILPAVQP